MTSKSVQFLFVWRKRLFRLFILFFSSRGGENEASGWRSIVVARSCKVFFRGGDCAVSLTTSSMENFPRTKFWWKVSLELPPNFGDLMKFPRLDCAGSDPFHQFHLDGQLVVVSRIYFGWINFRTEIMLSRVQSCGLLANRILEFS